MRALLWIAAFMVAGLNAGCKQEPKVEVPAANLALFPAIPEWTKPTGTPFELDRIELGRQLFFDPRLSKSQEISCNSCHNLDTFGVDNKPVSLGHKQQKGSRNSPTVYNAADHIAQFWDGRAKDLVEQAKGPILNPVEMAMAGEVNVLEVLRSIPQYAESFKKAFPGASEPITYTNVATAIAEFEKHLTTPSRWDRFVRGDQDALTNKEKAGFNKFMETGCMTCHFGKDVGGALFQKLGMVIPYPDQIDAGRFEATKNEADRMFFKVPSLRNVEKTAPYFHNGQVETLDQAVVLMAKHQLGRDLSKEDAASIATWLKSLTGDLPKDYIQKPDLPPNGENTPKPDPN